jgi:pimeloyl-ACP methyl ester carboxylesterase
MLGHDKFGSGPRAVIVLNDWLCDTSTWDGARAYLDGQSFTWVFTDLRGYGRSRGQRGKHNVEEAAADVLELARALDLGRFSVIGHSMSTLVALHLGQHQSDHIDRAVVLTPAPPRGLGADNATVETIQSLARGDDTKRMRFMQSRFAERFSTGFIRFKAERWRTTSDPDAVAEYAAMFARDGLPDPSAPVRVPLLAVTGDEDVEVMRREAVTKLLTPIAEQLVVESIVECGHYPMQETPPRLVAIVERFLTQTEKHTPKSEHA